MSSPTHGIREKTARFSRTEILLLIVLFATNWVVVTGTQMIPALFPALTRVFDTPLQTVVLLSSVLAFTGLLAPLFGPWADRYGHWFFLLIGLALFAAGNLACAAASSFWLLLVFYGIVGTSRTILNVVITSYVGDVFAYAVRGRAIGIVRSAISLALIAGVPLATAVTEKSTVRSAFLAVAILTGTTLLLNLVISSKRPSQVSVVVQSQASPPAWHSYAAVLKHREALLSLVVLSLWSFIPTGVFLYLATWLQATFAFSDAQVGLAFSIIGIGSLIGNGLAAISSDRLGKKRIALVGSLTLAVFAILLPWSGATWLALGCLLFFAIGLDLGSSAFFALLTELNREYRATLMSLATLTIGVATGFTPLLMRPFWQANGYALVTAALGVAGLGAALITGLFISEPQLDPTHK